MLDIINEYYPFSLSDRYIQQWNRNSRSSGISNCRLQSVAVVQIVMMRLSPNTNGQRVGPPPGEADWLKKIEGNNCFNYIRQVTYVIYSLYLLIA